jgi:hypothetical protein
LPEQILWECFQYLAEFCSGFFVVRHRFLFRLCRFINSRFGKSKLVERRTARLSHDLRIRSQISFLSLQQGAPAKRNPLFSTVSGETLPGINLAG